MRDYIIRPIPWMADVREGVLTNSDKRMPKWRFRLAPDLVMALQPKPVPLITARSAEAGLKQRILRFEGAAVMSEKATPAMLDKRPAGVDYLKLTFEIVAYQPDEWHVHLRSGGWTRNFNRTDWHNLFNRVVSVLDSMFLEELTEEKLLSHFCFVCGKALTDPASMARRIGPECAGTSSVRVPFVLKAAAE